jgi:branched-chain amino acid transport system permease protein
MNRKKMVKRMGSVALLLMLFLLPRAVTQPYVLHLLVIIGINVVLASSLRFIATSGQLSLAHAGMMSVGAYASTLLVMKLGLSFWVALPLGGLAAMTLAFLVGFPFVRLKGIYFTMVTLFLTEFIRLIAEQWKSLTGGPSGIIAIPRPGAVVIPGLLNADFVSKADFYYLALIIALVTLVILYAIESSRVGTTLLSIQQSDSLAESVGVNSSWLRVLAFAIGCFFAGLAGAFYSHYLSAINPGSFGFLVSIYILIYMVVGGMRKFAGPVIGAIILTIIPELAGGLKEYEPFAFAGILLLVIFFLRGGVVSLAERMTGARKKGVSSA